MHAKCHAFVSILTLEKYVTLVSNNLGTANYGPWRSYPTSNKKEKRFKLASIGKCNGLLQNEGRKMSSSQPLELQHAIMAISISIYICIYIV